MNGDILSIILNSFITFVNRHMTCHLWRVSNYVAV